jgi:hypothetical protein
MYITTSLFVYFTTEPQQSLLGSASCQAMSLGNINGDWLSAPNCIPNTINQDPI